MGFHSAAGKYQREDPWHEVAATAEPSRPPSRSQSRLVVPLHWQTPENMSCTFDFKLTERHLFPALGTHSLVLQQPRVNALHVIGMLTGQDTQFVADHIVVQANATGLVVRLISCHKLFGRDLLQARLGQPVPSLPPAVLDALEDHDPQHDDEADADDDGKGKEVGVDVKGLVVSQANNKGSQTLFICVMGHHLCPISMTDEHRRNHIISVSP